MARKQRKTSQVFTPRMTQLKLRARALLQLLDDLTDKLDPFNTIT